jgi:glycosyltransferase involved in cell wall biosynthesis
VSGAILFAGEYYPPFAPGGAEWSTAAWAAALARRGHPVTVVTPNYGAPAREERDGVKVVRVPFPLHLRPGQREAPWLLHRNALFYRYFGWHIRRIAAASGAAAIHAHGKAALVAGLRAGERLGIPVVATIRDVGLLCPLGFCTMLETSWTTFDCTTAQYETRCMPYFLEHYHGRAGALRRAWLHISLRLGWRDQHARFQALERADAVIGVSGGILAIYPERLVGGGRGRVVHTLPPAISAPPEPEIAETRRRLGIDAGPLVLYAGKLSPGKGTPVLIAALPEIRRAVPGARFVFAGKGELAPPAATDVHALGSIPQHDLFALYAGADLVVVPSVWPEPLSRVLLEAMQLGRPIVATRVGGTPEAVEHGVTGLLVERGDAAALAGAIVELLRDPERRAKMGAAARERAREVFREDRIVDALLDAYRAASARHAARGRRAA